MKLLTTFLSRFICVFRCNHFRTPVNEGKCYCPDCGRGLIYQWVVVRCEVCHQRMESRSFFRQVVPLQRCCAYCGEQGFRFDYLESPDYFQLHKAQLIVREEEDYLQRPYAWSSYNLGETVNRTWEKAMAKTRRWLEPAYTSDTILALLPAPIQA